MERLIRLDTVRTLSLFLLLLTSFFEVAVAETTYIPVGQAKTRKTILAIAPTQAFKGAASRFADEIQKTIYADLSFMGLFKFLPAETFLEDPMKTGPAIGQFDFSNWKSIGAELLIKSKVTIENHQLVFEAHLYDVSKAKELVAKRYVAATKDAKTIAHTFANDAIEKLTGLPGIFLTKLVMSCDRTKKKEIYVMNFDGTNVKQITHHRSIAFSPSWSPDGNQVVYSVYTRKKNNVKNIDLYAFYFSNNSIQPISNAKGMNTGATFSPDGKRIALVMSHTGNPEIFVGDARESRFRRSRKQLTRSWGFDVDPAWSPDGREIAFVSSRRGKPMIFKMKASPEGKNNAPERLTYAGRYNATPSWSPQNNKIAFAGWTDAEKNSKGRVTRRSGFDIFIMNPDGTNIERLTKNQGNNEDPSFSPDGNFIVFSSNRTGKKNVYVMNIDGTFVKRLSYGLGNCVAPKWSNPPKRN